MRQNIITKDRFTQLPEWVFPTTEAPSVYSFAAALALSQNENRWHYFSADTQRRVLGRFVGRMKLGLFDGELLYSRKVCFGTDSDSGPLSNLLR